jgi:nondiscriminating aspartyl-tRNA synthetase
MFKNRTLIKDLSPLLDQKATIAGMLYKKREVSSKLAFLNIKDRSGIIQVVIENDDAEIDKIKNLQVGSVLSIEAIVKSDSRSKIGLELKDPIISVLNKVDYPSPIEIDKEIGHKSENFDTLFDYRPINLRNWKEGRIFKVREAVKDAFREYLKSQDFTEFDSPKLLAGATEGGSEVFTLNYFGKVAALAQSAQFYKQIMVGIYERVFEINPTYRAELSFTPRHMTEFLHIDLEVGYISDHEELMIITENLLNAVIEKVWGKMQEELTLLEAVKPVLTEKFPRVTLKELFKLYKQETGIDDSHEKDPSPVHERFICEYSAKHWGSEAVFVTEFPSSEMKFYHKVNEQNPEVCERADLLFRGVEIATVPMREHRYDVLLAQMTKAGLDPEAEGNKYYMMAFKHGMPPHGGFGMGLERVVQKIIGLGSVKEASLFPRDVNRLAP